MQRRLLLFAIGLGSSGIPPGWAVTEERCGVFLLNGLDKDAVKFNRDTLKLKQCELLPMQIKNFSLHYANERDCSWLQQSLSKISVPFNTKFELKRNNAIIVEI